MFEKILVGIDGSVYSRVAEGFALRFAKIFNATITFIHVVDTIQVNEISKACSNLAFDPFLSFNKEIREACELEMSVLYQRGESLLKEAQEIAQKEGLTTEAILKTGIIPRVLEEVSCGYDLVFTGRKGINDEFVKDSVGVNFDAFLRRAISPIFVSSDIFYDIKNIILAFDSKHSSMRALEITKLICEKQENIYCEAIYLSQSNTDLSSSVQDLIFKNIILKNEETIADTIKHYVESSENPLLIIGKSNKSEIIREILGSTTESILRKSPKFPMLIVPWILLFLKSTIQWPKNYNGFFWKLFLLSDFRKTVQEFY